MALDQKKRAELYEEWRRRGKLRPAQWRQVGRMAKAAVARRVAEIENSGVLAAPPVVIDIPLRKFRPPDAHLSQREPAANSALGAEVASADASPTPAPLFTAATFTPEPELVPEPVAQDDPSTYTWERLAAARRHPLPDEELETRNMQPRPWSEAALVESGDECMLLNEERWRPQPLAPTCRYIRINGGICFDPPEQRGLCGRHARWDWLLPAAQGLPCPEDRASMFEVLSQTMAMLLSGRIKPAKATAIASLCREMQRCW